MFLSTAISRATTRRAPSAFLEVANDPGVRRAVVRARRLWLGTASPSGAGRLGRRRAPRPISATATWASCSAALYAPGFQRRAWADAGRSHARGRRGGGGARACAIWSMRAPDTLEPSVGSGRAGGRVQHHRAQPPARHAAGARPRRSRADAGGSVGAPLPRSTARCFTSLAQPGIRGLRGIRLGR